jgi:hypothetical protein
MKPGRAGTMTHDYKRHGTTTLFAALNILDRTVVGHNMQRHRRQEFNRFLNTDAKNSSLDLAGLFDQEFRDVTDLFHRSRCRRRGQSSCRAAIDPCRHD